MTADKLPFARFYRLIVAVDEENKLRIYADIPGDIEKGTRTEFVDITERLKQQFDELR